MPYIDTETVDESDVNAWVNPFNNPDLNKKITIKDSIRDSEISTWASDKSLRS